MTSYPSMYSTPASAAPAWTPPVMPSKEDSEPTAPNFEESSIATQAQYVPYGGQPQALPPMTYGGPPQAPSALYGGPAPPPMPYNYGSRAPSVPPPAPYAGPSAVTSAASEGNDIDWSGFCSRLDINPKLVPFLRLIRTVTTVLLCDDSGSMQNRADPDTGNPMTRWDELKQAVSIAIDAHATAGCSCDIYFINRPEVFRGVTSWSQVERAFYYGPSGGTNTVATLQMIAYDHLNADRIGVKPVLVHIFTDGHPTNSSGREDIYGLESWLVSRPSIDRCYISIVLCTDEPEIDEMYRRFEWNPASWNGKGIKNVDVTEDFRGEQRDIRRTRGRRYPFSFGDFVVKILVGPLDPSIHLVDLPAGTFTKRAAGGKQGMSGMTPGGNNQDQPACCSIS